MSVPVFDPFFDAGPRATGQLDRQNIVTRDGYTDVTQAVLENGQPVMQALPMGPNGTRGVVIPGHTSGGVPQGYNPHNLQGVELIIDPHIHGQGAKVSLHQLAKDSVAQASNEATAALMDPEISAHLKDPMARRRFRASMALHGINTHQPTYLNGDDQDIARDLPVTQEKAAEVARRPQQLPPQQPPPQRHPNQQQQGVHAPQPPQPVRSPLAAFGQPAGVVPPPPQNIPASAPMNVIDTSQMQQTIEQAGQPTRKVVFEFPETGVLEAYYHDVIHSDATLVLVYDLRHQGMKYFPPQTSGQQMACHVDGTDVVYLVEATGIQYPHGSCTHCVLSIIQEAPYG